MNLTPPGFFPGRFCRCWEQIPGHAQNPLDGPYVDFGLGIPWDLLKWEGERHWGPSWIYNPELFISIHHLNPLILSGSCWGSSGHKSKTGCPLQDNMDKQPHIHSHLVSVFVNFLSPQTKAKSVFFFCLCHLEVITVWIPDRKGHQISICAKSWAFKCCGLKLLLSWWLVVYLLIPISLFCILKLYLKSYNPTVQNVISCHFAISLKILIKSIKIIFSCIYELV